MVGGGARLRSDQSDEELSGRMPDVVVGDAQLVEIGTAPRWQRVVTRQRGVVAGTLDPQFVASDQMEVGGVDEQLGLRDPDGQKLRHVLVGQGVAVALPGDEALDIAEPIHDAGGVVGVLRQRAQVGLLLGEEVDRCAAGLPVASQVAGAGAPRLELLGEVGLIAEAPPIEEAALQLPEAALDGGLVVGVTGTAGERLEFVVGGEVDEARIVDGLASLPPQHDRLLVVVLADMGGAAEPCKGLDVAVEERVQIDARVEAVVLAVAVGQRVAEGLDPCVIN